MIIVLWILFATLLLCWSGTLWAVNALLHLPAGWTDAVQAWMDALPMALWLERWTPGWREVVLLAADVAQALLHTLSALTPWLTALLWVVWGVGAFGLLLVGGLLHAVIRASMRTELQARASAA
jgi:hypothetical protein